MLSQTQKISLRSANQDPVILDLHFRVGVYLPNGLVKTIFGRQEARTKLKRARKNRPYSSR